MTTIDDPTSIPFGTFWSWLKRHTGCILRVGTPDIYVNDHELFHWMVDEDADNNPSIFLFFGKALISEVLMEARDVHKFVHVFPAKDPENPEHCLFQILGGAEDEEPYPMVQLLMDHGIEEEPQAGLMRAFKH